MTIRDKNIVHALTSDGIALDCWFALGDHLVGHFDQRGRLMAKINDNELAAAAVKSFGSANKFMIRTQEATLTKAGAAFSQKVQHVTVVIADL